MARGRNRQRVKLFARWEHKRMEHRKRGRSRRCQCIWCETGRGHRDAVRLDAAIRDEQSAREG
jgi:hypothetical protein